MDTFPLNLGLSALWPLLAQSQSPSLVSPLLMPVPDPTASQLSAGSLIGSESLGNGAWPLLPNLGATRFNSCYCQKGKKPQEDLVPALREEKRKRQSDAGSESETSSEAESRSKKFKLSPEQKERKSVREKKKRKLVSKMFEDLEKMLLEKGVISRASKKLRRLEILRAFLDMLVSKGITLESQVSMLVNAIFRQSPSNRQFEEIEDLSNATSEEAKKRIKSENEKKRRDKVKALLIASGMLLGLNQHTDHVIILQKLLATVKSS